MKSSDYLGTCIKCDRDIADGGHERCQVWMRDEIIRLRHEVTDLMADWKEDRSDYRREMQAMTDEIDEARRDLQRFAVEWDA